MEIRLGLDPRLGGLIITVSTRDDKQSSEIRSCTYTTDEDDPPVEPAGGLGSALPMLMALEIFALMTFAKEGVNTRSLLRDLLRVDIVRDEGVAWCTSKTGAVFICQGWQ